MERSSTVCRLFTKPNLTQMNNIFFNEEWNEENEKQEHIIDSISEYRNRTTNIHIDKKRGYLSDLYFFE